MEADHRTEREEDYYMLIKWTSRRPATRKNLCDALVLQEIIRSGTLEDHENPHYET